MPDLHVHYIGLIQRTVGKRDERISLGEGARIEHLVQELVRRYGRDLEERLLDGDELGPLVTILVDGVNCAGQGGLQTKLDTQGQVEIVVLGPPPMGG